MDVPEGDYTIELFVEGPGWGHYSWTHTGTTYGYDTADTIRVDSAHSPVEIQFELGSIAFDLGVFGALDREHAGLRLHRRDVDKDRSHTYIEDFSLDIEHGRIRDQVPGVLPGEYLIEIRYLASQQESFWLPFTHDPEQARWYRVGVDSLLTVTLAQDFSPAHIRGSVTGAWQELGFSPPMVFFVSPDSVLIAHADVRTSGEFDVPLYVLGPLKIGIEQSIRQWVGGTDFQNATVFHPQPGGTISGIHFTQSGIRFHLNVPGDYAESVSFELRDAASSALIGTVATWPAYERYAAVTNLAPGEFLIYISPSRLDLGQALWRPQWYDRAAAVQDAKRVTVSYSGEVINCDLFLELGGSIAGEVRYARSYFYVMVTRVDNPEPWAYDSFPVSASFQFLGLPDGDYKIGAWDGHIPWDGGPAPAGAVWYPGTTDWNQAGVLQISDANAIAGIVIDIPE